MTKIWKVKIQALPESEIREGSVAAPDKAGAERRALHEMSMQGWHNARIVSCEFERVYEFSIVG